MGRKSPENSGNHLLDRPKETVFERREEVRWALHTLEASVKKAARNSPEAQRQIQETLARSTEGPYPSGSTPDSESAGNKQESPQVVPENIADSHGSALANTDNLTPEIIEKGKRVAEIRERLKGYYGPSQGGGQ